MEPVEKWLTRDEVMEILDVKERTLKSLKHLERQQVRLPGKTQKETVYEPEGVEKERIKRNRPILGPRFPATLPPRESVTTQTEGDGPSGLATSSQNPALMLQALTKAFVQAVQASRAGVQYRENPEDPEKPKRVVVVPPEGKLRVSMAEAVGLGFNREDLVELVREGKLENVGKPKRYRFRRRDLEAL